jgi:4'-phosphopantetheinyl transferase
MAADYQLQLALLGQADEFALWLTPGERDRAACLSEGPLRTRFVVSRGLRRQMLSACTGRPAQTLEFEEDGTAKPRLVDGEGWDFNLSHAGEHVAVVVRRGAVGIDLEHHGKVRDQEGIVSRYFHPDEAQAWQCLPAELQAGAFFRLWSAREAAMKCAGLGLARGIRITRIDPGFIETGAAMARVGEEIFAVNVLAAPADCTLVVATSPADD